MFTFILCLGPLLVTSVLSAKQSACEPYPYVYIEHGTIRKAGPHKFTFKCDEGYFLSSPSSVRCFRGNWTYSKQPKCIRIRGLCDDPPRVDHARIFGDERHVDATVQYVCEEGYVLLGHPELSCTKNQHWNKRAPTCMDESEPLKNVAERLKNSFVTHLSYHSSGTPEGRLLDRSSLLHGLELYILIDRSSSVDPVHLEEAKKFVKFLLRRFNVSNKNNPNGTRAAVLAFGTDVQTVFGIDNETIINPRIASEAVDEIQPNGGGTNMEEALTKALIDADPQMQKLRPRAKRALFLMTDGEPNIANPGITPENIADQLKKSGDFEIFTVGIGKGIRMSLLNTLASEPPLSHVFVLKEYPDLKDVMKIIEDNKPAAKISQDQCGYNASKENGPWLATLYIGDDPFRICSGVLICSQWVLTTASCLLNGSEPFHKKDVFVVLGEKHLLQNDEHQKNFYVVEMVLHLSFDPDNVIQNNLGLLKLNLPARRYKPACLPLTDRAVPLHQNLQISASIAGWGRTSASEMTVVRAGDVSFEMHATSVSLSTEDECPVHRRGETPLCASQGSKTCFGLVGSPLMAEDSTTGFQHVLGILVDRKYCNSRSQNQYIELTKYLAWINHVTSNCQAKHWGLA